MKVILIISLILLIAGVVLWIHDRITRRHNGGSVTSEEVQSAATAQEDETDSEDCCGMHMTCERDSLLTAVSPEVVYYDDEELDRFRGRGADDYSDEEIEEFRDVLLTLLPDDIAGWGRSIQMRDINLPTSIRQELLMIVAEAREARSRQHA
ncbi:phospholipase [Muribaculum intestinale]|uniref:Phospholipase n=1 Tax=Muribaculum intestinale TaxID=1796646 RepID=A0A4S2FX55_9BACT|nr:phospholipase [Muribaculum intestinale]MYM12453.1 phospholipase [Muribaculum intestinale]TGY74025.1 phospholipase [Muribaculum intestinale]